MFEPVRMKRLRLISLAEHRDPILKVLHEAGVMQISDWSDKFDDSEWSDVIQPHPIDPVVKDMSTLAMTVNRYLELFDEVCPEKEEGFFKMLFNPSPPKTVSVEHPPREALLEDVREVTKKIEEELSEQLRRREEINTEISELQDRCRSIRRITGLDIDLADVGQTQCLVTLVGLLKNPGIVAQVLQEHTGDLYYLWAEDGRALIVYPAEFMEAIGNELRRAGFERIDVEGLKGTPREAIDSINARIQSLEDEKAEIESRISECAARHREKLKAFHELLEIERTRVDIQTSLAKTERTFVLSGWIPATEVDDVKRKLREAAGGEIAIDAIDPDVSDEHVPVLLDNPKYLENFEVLTRLYSLPKYNEVDPTTMIVPSFLLFFGFMLTDAAYGLMALVLGALLLRGGGKYYESIRDFGIILVSAGVATVFMGVITGGWLGNLPTLVDFLQPLQSMTMIDPLGQVQQFLLLSLFVGLIHLNLGMIVSVYRRFKNDDIVEAFKEHLWVFLAQIGIVVAVFVNTMAGALIAVVGLGLLIWGHKGMFFFSLTGFVGDFLSYARLMALGLVTAGIGMTVNVLTDMTLSLGIIGLIIAPFVFVGGHIFNFGMNALGAFVHGIRLHYVEFFSKFYDGGGREFAPFQASYDFVNPLPEPEPVEAEARQVKEEAKEVAVE